MDPVYPRKYDSYLKKRRGKLVKISIHELDGKEKGHLLSPFSVEGAINPFYEKIHDVSAVVFSPRTNRKGTQFLQTRASVGGKLRAV